MTNNQFWDKKRIVVTGGAGFLGSYVMAQLQQTRCSKIFAPRSNEYDLRQKEAVIQLYKDTKPNIVIHLAATVGGIGTIRENPAKFLYNNLMMGAQTLHYAYHYGVEKFVTIGTVCSYPKIIPVPFKENDLWVGYPEETNAPYGLAKKMLLVQGQAYQQQHGFNTIHLLPVNLYGPRDNFNLETSHVIPALIHKFVIAQENKLSKVDIWGDGSATREFLYAEDCAKGIILATERYNKTEPVNIGTGLEVSIKYLANLIAKLTSFQGEIVWDTTKPGGQPRRCLNVERAKREFGFQAKVSLEKGLLKTIEWYKNTII